MPKDSKESKFYRRYYQIIKNKWIEESPGKLKDPLLRFFKISKNSSAWDYFYSVSSQLPPYVTTAWKSKPNVSEQQ